MVGKILLWTLAAGVVWVAGAVGVEKRDSACTVTFHGGAGEVGGSCATVERDGVKMLVDCGTAYGETSDRSHPTPTACGFAFDPKTYGHLLITHAHQDHAGRVPELFHAGFTGTVWTTTATRELLAVAWKSQIVYDTCTERTWRWTRRGKKAGTRVHWRTDCEWARKISGANLGTFRGVYPQLERHLGAATYPVACQTCQELERQALVGRVRSVPYGSPQALGPFTVTFLPVKHLPGAAAIRVEDAAGSCIFSGDLGTRRSRFVKTIEPAPKADAVFLETTYGDATQGTAEEIERDYARFRKVVGETVRAGGVAWIPAFALDRSQRVLLEVKRGMDAGEIPAETPVHYLSPSSREYMALYVAHPDWFDCPADVAALEPLYRRTKTFFNPRSKRPHGAILLTTSGMMDTGTSLRFIPDLVPLASTAICLVGYQSPGTCGHQLKEIALGTAKERLVRVPGDGADREIPVRASVHVFACFSGHGDASENDAWLANNHASRILLVHGDRTAMKARVKGLKTRLGAAAEIVEPGTGYRITHE